MPKSSVQALCCSKAYKLPKLALVFSWKDPRILVRTGLGVLLAANLVAAAFAFHIVGSSPEAWKWI